MADDTGLEEKTQSHAMIFNLLHLENPVELLKEAYRVLQSGGKLSVIHWRSDIPTPRGPALDIRPTPEQCRGWVKDAGFHLIRDVDLTECCQFHFGVLGISIAFDETLWAGVIIAFAVLAVAGLGFGLLCHRQPWPIFIGGLGVAILVYAMYVRYGRLTEISGFILLCLAAFWDWRLRRRLTVATRTCGR